MWGTAMRGGWFFKKGGVEKVNVWGDNVTLSENFWVNPAVEDGFDVVFKIKGMSKGAIFHDDIDEWAEPKPYPSWILDEENLWVPPVPEPVRTPNKVTIWNEETQTWDLVD